MPTLRPLVALALLLAALLVARSPAAQAPGAVDFHREVAPILRASCIECHGVDEQRGGLRLDQRELAENGGDSGGAILGGPLAENELWRRVSSPDDDFRMPKGGQLSDEDLSVLRRWIEAQSPWPDPRDEALADDEGAAAGSAGPGPKSTSAFATLVRALRHRHLELVVAVLVLMLMLETAKRVAERTGETGGPVLAVARRMRLPYYGLALLAICIASLVGENKEMREQQVAFFRKPKSNTFALDKTQIFTHYLYGTPPVPPRPEVARSLQSTYYRGNCERKPYLFNGGVYRTAVLGVGVYDRERRPLAIGDAVPTDGLLVKFEILRSPNTADTMYSEERMSTVFLTEEWYQDRVLELEAPYTTLEVLEPEQHWVAYFPVQKRADESGNLAGLVYVFVNLRDDGRPFRPNIHYGVKYELRVVDGRLAEGSDVWLGNLWWRDWLEFPPVPSGRVTQEEWLDTAPLPEIPDGFEYHKRRTQNLANTPGFR